MDLPPAVVPSSILNDLVVRIVRDANSPEEAAQIANDLLAYLNEHLPVTDWQAEIERPKSLLYADEAIFGSIFRPKSANKAESKEKGSTAAPPVPGKRFVKPFGPIKLGK